MAARVSGLRGQRLGLQVEEEDPRTGQDLRGKRQREAMGGGEGDKWTARQGPGRKQSEEGAFAKQTGSEVTGAATT